MMASQKTLTLVVIITFLFSASCTTSRVISTRTIEPQSDTIQNELKKGDLVRITTKEGNSFELRIADVSSEAIISSKEITEIAKIVAKQETQVVPGTRVRVTASSS